MHVRTICEVLSLLALANVSPIAVKNLAGARWSWPVDGGLTFFDHRPLFGASKTVRGVGSSVLITSIGAVVMGMDWDLGAKIAAWSMGGDLFSSFCKRRLGLAAGSRATGLDQIPEALFPVVAVHHALSLSALDVATIVVIFMIGEMGLSVLFFRWHLRERPY